MIKKIVLISIISLFLIGCSSQYNLELKNGKLYETIIADIEDRSSNITFLSGMEEDDVGKYFINSNQYPFADNMDIVYDKKISKENNNTRVVLKYNYTEKEFERATVLKKCFQNSSYEHGDIINLRLSGEFYCLHGSQLFLNIKTNYKVTNNNADRKKGNVYTWIINSDNFKNVSVILAAEKYYYLKKFSIAITAISIVVVASIVYFRIRKKEKHANKI